MKAFRRSAPPADREFEGKPVLLEARAESHSQPGRAVSGNGRLILTDQELVFEQRVPHRLVRAPRASISGISTPRSFNMKIFPKLLKVEWEAESGLPDSIVLTVNDVDRWVEALRQPR